MKIYVHCDYRQLIGRCHRALPAGNAMDVKKLLGQPVLKLMNVLVFIDSFILVFVGVCVKGGQSIIFGALYGAISGAVALLLFDAAIVLMLTFVLNGAAQRSRQKF